MKSQSFSTYQSFRPRDLFPHLKDLLIVLIVKSLDTSMSAYIRISSSEVGQWSVRVTRPHVLHKLAIHPEICAVPCAHSNLKTLTQMTFNCIENGMKP